MSNMIDNDDPRLTAYAMAELEGAEREAFEALLKDDPAAQAEVEAIRAFGGTLATEMQKAPCPALTEVQRARVVNAITPVSPYRVAAPPWYFGYVGQAAVVLVIGGVLLLAATTKFKNALQNAYVAGADRIQTKITDEIVGDSYAAAIDQSVVDALSVGGRESDEVKYDHFVTRYDIWSNGPNGADERHAPNGHWHAEHNTWWLDGADPALEEDVTRALGRDPTAAGAWSERAKLRVAQGDLAGAIADCDRAIALDPADARALAWRSLARRYQGDMEGAAKDAERALELDPKLPDVVRLNAATGPAPAPVDNPFKPTATDSLSTFSIDVDTASYANVRRYLQQQSCLPPREAVRLEELINYFPYDYAQPTGEHPFATNVEVASCPWAPEHRLVRVGLKGREQAAVDRPATNLVFLIDVSGSMSATNKLPLVKRSLELLVEQLRPQDRVAIVVYAGASGVVLESTPGDRKAEISAALERLAAGGSTNGGAGIQLAYDIASRHFAESGGVNRVVLCTDGDWNVGVQSQEALQTLIADKAKSNVFLSVLGFGMAHNDSTLELLADKGNGNYAFVDTLAEARKVLVDQLSSTLVTIAKDVKIQVEWNRDTVASYRLIGYENRVLAARDFADDTKDAGEIGAGHTVTALYEVVPTAPVKQSEPRQLMTLRLRYKQPLGDVSRLLEQPAVDAGRSFDQASPDFRFAAGVAAFGLVLRDSPHKGSSSLALAHQLIRDGVGKDPHGLRGELVELVKGAAQIAKVSLEPPPAPSPSPRVVTPPPAPATTDAAAVKVTLQDVDGAARVDVSGDAARLPDGTLVHVSLVIDGTAPPAELGFFRMAVRGGRYEGHHGWEKKRFAPLAYRTEVRLHFDVQNPTIKRFLSRELGWQAEHVEVLGSALTVVGTDEERRVFEVESLRALRDLQVGAATLLGELGPHLERADSLFDEALFLERLAALEDSVAAHGKGWVASLDPRLVVTLRSALLTLRRVVLGKREGREGVEKPFATAVEDVRAVGELIERRMPR